MKVALQMNATSASQANLLSSLTRSLPEDDGRTVLNLVFHAAELFSGMEEQVRAAEARANPSARVQLKERKSPKSASALLKGRGLK